MADTRRNSINLANISRRINHRLAQRVASVVVVTALGVGPAASPSLADIAPTAGKGFTRAATRMTPVPPAAPFGAPAIAVATGVTPLQDPGPGDEKKTAKEEKPPKDKPAKEEGGEAGPVTDPDSTEGEHR